MEDSIGIMVYEGTQSLNYVKNFVNGVLTYRRAYKNIFLTMEEIEAGFISSFFYRLTNGKDSLSPAGLQPI